MDIQKAKRIYHEAYGEGVITRKVDIGNNDWLIEVDFDEQVQSKSFKLSVLKKTKLDVQFFNK